LSDPASEGPPDTADDNSSAYDDVDTGRRADGPNPAALPSDRPQAVDRFGTTADEQPAGESLDYRRSQEEPDVQPEDPLDSPGALAGEAIDEQAAQARLDADVYGESPTSDPEWHDLTTRGGSSHTLAQAGDVPRCGRTLLIPWGRQSSAFRLRSPQR
jgi:hypothetical protein